MRFTGMSYHKSGTVKCSITHKLKFSDMWVQCIHCIYKSYLLECTGTKHVAASLFRGFEVNTNSK